MRKVLNEMWRLNGRTVDYKSNRNISQLADLVQFSCKSNQKSPPKKDGYCLVAVCMCVCVCVCVCGAVVSGQDFKVCNLISSAKRKNRVATTETFMFAIFSACFLISISLSDHSKNRKFKSIHKRNDKTSFGTPKFAKPNSVRIRRFFSSTHVCTWTSHNAGNRSFFERRRRPFSVPFVCVQSNQPMNCTRPVACATNSIRSVDSNFCCRPNQLPHKLSVAREHFFFFWIAHFLVQFLIKFVNQTIAQRSRTLLDWKSFCCPRGRGVQLSVVLFFLNNLYSYATILFD